MKRSWTFFLHSGKIEQNGKEVVRRSLGCLLKADSKSFCTSHFCYTFRRSFWFWDRQKDLEQALRMQGLFCTQNTKVAQKEFSRVFKRFGKKVKM